LRVEEAEKSTPRWLSGYVKYGATRRTRVPFYVMVFCFIIEKKNWVWEIREENRGG
jgi:hypothetical protein